MKKSFKKVFVPHSKTNPTPLFWHPVSVVTFALITLFICFTMLFTSDEALKPHTLLGDIRTGVIVALTNQNRQQYNLNELTQSDLLAKAATNKAQHMALNQYFAHYSPQGVSPWFWFAQSEYQYEKAGENLAVLFNDSDKVVNAWMNSPSHRANLLKDGYTEIGVGTAEGIYKGKQTTYIVQFFAKPKQGSNQTLFAFESQNKNMNQPSNVQGIETVNFSISTLFNKEYLLFTIVFILSGILFITALTSLIVFFIKHSHNNSILKLYVLCISVSFFSLACMYLFLLKDSTFL